MNKFATVALFALLFTLASAAPKNQRYIDTKTVLAELDKAPFGNTMLSLVQLNLSAKSPIEDVMLLIDEIINGLESDQAEADEKNKTDQAVCDETIAGFQAQIAETTQVIASLEKAIADNTEILNQAEADLVQAQKDYDETVTAIQEGTAERLAAHDKWAEEDYQNSISIATLEEGVKLIQHMIHGVAFAQIKTRYDKVLEKLQNSPSKHASLFKPVIASLTQLATKLNYENVMKILDLLNNIRAGIVEEKLAARTAEEKAQADWEILLAHLQQQKRSLQEKIARLQALIESTKILLKQLNESLENHRVELENLQESLAAQIAWCNEQSETYLTETAERNRELEILNLIRTHLQEKAQQVSDYLAQRAAGAPEF